MIIFKHGFIKINLPEFELDLFQQARYIEPIQFNVGPALKLHWFNPPCVLGRVHICRAGDTFVFLLQPINRQIILFKIFTILKLCLANAIRNSFSTSDRKLVVLDK